MDLFASPITSIIFGWIGILAGFLSGGLLGMATADDSALGGYGSLQRRYIRLGHIAMAALGMINILAGLTSSALVALPPLAMCCLTVGMVAMPVACFIYANIQSRQTIVFAIPVVTLLTGSAMTVWTLLQNLTLQQ